VVGTDFELAVGTDSALGVGTADPTSVAGTYRADHKTSSGGLPLTIKVK